MTKWLTRKKTTETIPNSTDRSLFNVSMGSSQTNLQFEYSGQSFRHFSHFCSPSISSLTHFHETVTHELH